jgi:hypothetical protein
MKNKKQYEAHLNELYNDCFTQQEAQFNFEYLTSKWRHPRTTKKHILNMYERRELGTLLRKLDPIAFNVGFNEWNKK